MMNMNQILQKIDTYFAENQGQEAEHFMLDCMEQAVAEADDGALLQLLNELLGYYRETSQAENSYIIAARAIALAEQMGLQESIQYATTLLNVANAYRAGGKLQESLQYYKRVREIYGKSLSPDNLLVASLENNISLLYQEMGEYAKAKECLMKALDIVKEKKADFEIAVTYANLATTCILLQELEEAYAYGSKAVELFEGMGVEDFHYGAALAALGSFHFQNKSYSAAKYAFGQARDIMEKSLGRNEYYYRLTENLAECDKALALHSSAKQEVQESEALCAKAAYKKGLEICKEYYEAYGRPMIAEQFPEYESRIAVGLVGEGSDCFGYDDELSMDHDWGPDLCLWVTEETYQEIGEALEQAYENLPKEFQGYQRTISAKGVGRRGVMTIPAFYERLLQTATREQLDWRSVPDASLAAAVNGKVFRDDEGIFTDFREKLQKGFPENILYLKLAESAARFSQAGQYNYKRMKQRGDKVTAQIMLADAAREAMKLKHYLERKYPPHDKWLRRSMEELPGGREISECLNRLCEDVFTEDNGIKDNCIVALEQIAALLAKELYEKNDISDIEPYLDAHTEELLSKAALALYSDAELVDKITQLEFEAFDKVRNVGGRADCQNDWPTFSIMRKSQYLTWNRTMLLQYYFDFHQEYYRGHNLIEEKYGRMMESTAPEEYEQIKSHFPVISPEKKAIIEEIVKLQVDWMEEFAEQYPYLANNARSVHSEEDHLYNTSYETYLRGEISTYSDKMLELYGRYVVEYARAGKNLAYEIMDNSAHLYGYADLAAAERFLGV